MTESAILGPEALVGVFQALTSQDATAIAREMQAFVDLAKAEGMQADQISDFLALHGINGGDDFRQWIEKAYAKGYVFKKN